MPIDRSDRLPRPISRGLPKDISGSPGPLRGAPSNKTTRSALRLLEDHLQHVLSLYPGQPDATLLLARVRLSEGNRDEALRLGSRICRASNFRTTAKLNSRGSIPSWGKRTMRSASHSNWFGSSRTT